MPSVNPVSSSSSDVRFSTQAGSAQNQTDSDPFSLLLNAVTDGNVSAGETTPPQSRQAARDDVPVQQNRRDNSDRPAKQNSEKADKPEASAKDTRPVKPEADAAAEDDNGDDEHDDAATAAIDAALLATLNATQGEQPQAVPSVGDAVATVKLTVNAEAAAATQTTAPAVAEGAGDLSVELQAAQNLQAQTDGKAAKPSQAIGSAAFAAEVEAIAKPEAPIAQGVANNTDKQAKPVSSNANVNAHLQVQQLQPGSVNVTAATPLAHALPSQLEALQAAMAKHVQLSLGVDTGSQPADGAAKPVAQANTGVPAFAVLTPATPMADVRVQAQAETARPVPLENLAVEIATRAKNGERRFDIRLDPPELGRIDVRLEIDSKGNTSTKLIVERSETLDMLQRDARGLEKALQNAGLKTDAGGLEFSLRQDTQAQQGQHNHPTGFRERPDTVQASAEVMTEVQINNASLAAQIRGGVDIRI